MSTCKGSMGAAHFLTKTLPKGKTEMSRQVLAYNVKRMMKILTPEGLIDVLQTRGCPVRCLPDQEAAD